MSDTTVWIVGPAIGWEIDLQVFPDPEIALNYYATRDNQQYEIVGTDRCIIIRTDTNDAYYGHAKTIIERTPDRYDYATDNQHAAPHYAGR